MINFGKVFSSSPLFVYHFPLFVDPPFFLFAYLDILVSNTWNMKKILTILTVALFITAFAKAQTEPNAGNWKTWFISSGKDHRLPAPGDHKKEIAAVLTAQKELDAAAIRQIEYWNAGSPGYHWQELVAANFMTDTGNTGVYSYMLLNVAIYDATIAAWDAKYAYKRPRPFAADSRIKAYGVNPQSPSYPCEHSVAAGVATTIFSKFFPRLADSVNRMAQRQMASRVAAGLAFPEDTRAGFELGKKIAEKEIAHTKDFLPKTGWDGTMPQGPQYYNGKFAMFPTAGQSKPVVLTSGNQFRPPPPPDFAKDMEELKKFKQTFRSKANAWYYGSQNSGEDMLAKKIFEHNYHLNPPRAARIYALNAIGVYDGFVACWDAKYAYWGIRPDQYDTTYKSLLPTPPFPGYPSGHAAVGGVTAELMTYLFPEDKALWDKRAKDGAESRFHAGIHFRSDNEVGIELGRKVGKAIVERVKNDGADPNPAYSAKKQ
jgi:membrane-associated phospholipid phosphatase